jgi:two-component system sensor histidine kinase HydH
VNAAGQLIPLLLFGALLLVLGLPWAAARFARGFGRKRTRPSETAFLLRTVQDVVTGIRASESDLRDLYSRAERKASFLERYHQGILESLNTGVVACNRRGEITSLNRAAATILGLPASKARGMPLDDLLGPGHIFGRMLAAAVQGKAVEDRMELQARREGEQPLWIELRTSILHGRSGQAVGAAFLLDDITERKILRRQVALKERLAAMGEISAGIAHEFRNALHALAGLAKLIARRAEGDARIGPLAEEVLGETARMERILDELRLFVRPDELRSSTFSVPDLVRSVLVPFAGDPGASGVRFQMAMASPLPALTGDRALLAQALRNLVQNAVQAMGGTGTLTVRGIAFGAGGGDPSHVRIAVQDTGPGIPDGVREKIFTPFFTTRPEGTGLGLPLVQKAVASHGGSVEVESGPGQGSVFTLFIPVGHAGRSGGIDREEGTPRETDRDAASERAPGRF